MPGMGRLLYHSATELLSLHVTKTDGNQPGAQELAEAALRGGINLCPMEKRQPKGKHNPASVLKWSQDKLAADGHGNESTVASSGRLG